MNEEQTRAMIREEIRAAFHLLEDAAHDAWSDTRSDSVEESCSEMIWASAKSVVKSLTPPDDDSEVGELIDQACEHIYKSCEDSQGNGGASCVLCYEREPEPVNPFAPKRTPEQWAEALRTLIREAHEDGSELWIDVEYCDGYAPKVRIGPPTSAGGEDPVVWEKK